MFCSSHLQTFECYCFHAIEERDQVATVTREGSSLSVFVYNQSIHQSINQSNKQKIGQFYPREKTTLGHTLGQAALFFCSTQKILHVLFNYVSCFAGISCWLFLQMFL